MASRVSRKSTSSRNRVPKQRETISGNVSSELLAATATSLWPGQGNDETDYKELRKSCVQDIRKSRRAWKSKVAGACEAEVGNILFEVDAEKAAMESQCGCLHGGTVRCLGAHACQGSKAVRLVCGNPVDAATEQARIHRTTDVSRARVVNGDMYGFELLEQSLWEIVDDHNVVARTSEVDALPFCTTAYNYLGLRPVRKVSPTGAFEGMMMGFNKDDIPGDREAVMSVVSAIGKLKHRHVVRFIQACEDEDTLYLIFESMGGVGHLPLQIASKKRIGLTGCIKLFQEMSAALAAGERSKLHLMDWSTWNIFSDSFYNLTPVRLFGLGLAGVLYEQTSPSGDPLDSQGRGAFYYRAPELSKLDECDGNLNPYMKIDRKFRPCTDVWGCMAVALTCLTGHPPVTGPSHEIVRKRIAESEVAFTGNEVLSMEAEGLTLIQRSLHMDPSERPTTEEILSHPWVAATVIRGSPMKIDVVVDRLQHFADQPVAIKSMGHLFAEVLQVAKRSAIDEMFCSIDLRGDDVVEECRLIGVATHRRGDIKKIAEKTELANGLSAESYRIANVFSCDILSDRMIEEVFCKVDANLIGTISPDELLTAVQKGFPEVTRQDFVDLLANAKVNGVDRIDLESFAKCLPETSMAQQRMVDRIAQKSDVHALNLEGFSAMREVIDNWLGKFSDGMDSMNKLKLDDLSASGAMKNVQKMVDIFAKFFQLLKKCPRVQFPCRTAQVLGRRKIVRPDPSRTDFDGIMALDRLTFVYAEAWHDMFKKIENKCCSVNFVDLPVERVQILKKVNKFTNKGVELIEHTMQNLVSEQVSIFEACGTVELHCLPRLWQRPGLSTIVDVPADAVTRVPQPEQSQYSNRESQGVLEERREHDDRQKDKRATLNYMFKELVPAITSKLTSTNFGALRKTLA